MALMPDLPSIRAFQLCSMPIPSGVTSPIPVTTTRLTIGASCNCPAPMCGASEMRMSRHSVVLMGLDEADRILDGDDLLGISIRNLAAELFLECHDQLDRVEAVGAEIVDEAGILGDLGLFDAEMVNNDLFNPFGDITHV